MDVSSRMDEPNFAARTDDAIFHIEDALSKERIVEGSFNGGLISRVQCGYELVIRDADRARIVVEYPELFVGPLHLTRIHIPIPTPQMGESLRIHKMPTLAREFLFHPLLVRHVAPHSGNTNEVAMRALEQGTDPMIGNGTEVFGQ